MDGRGFRWRLLDDMNGERAFSTKQFNKPKPHSYLLLFRLRPTLWGVATLKHVKLLDPITKVRGHYGEQFAEQGAMAFIPHSTIEVCLTLLDRVEVTEQLAMGRQDGRIPVKLDLHQVERVDMVRRQREGALRVRISVRNTSS